MYLRFFQAWILTAVKPHAGPEEIRKSTVEQIQPQIRAI